MKKYRTSAMCPRCGKELYTSDVLGYSFVCELCDENFYTIEIKNCSADFWNNITQEANQLWKNYYPCNNKRLERKITEVERIGGKI